MCKHTEKSNNKADSHPKYDPVVFVNNPISSEEFDAVGFDTQISTIMKGIENGATMIGIIADYGAGKSSMTELLCKKIVDIGYPSIVFQKRICTPKNIELVDTIEKRDHIREQLWSSNPYHKGVFTRKWNERWQDRLENVCV